MNHEDLVEARSVLLAGRAWVEEWLEEGVEGIDPAQLLAARAAMRAQVVAPAPAAPTAPTLVAPPTPKAPEVTAPLAAVPAPAPSFVSSVTLDEVRAELGECTRCGLCDGRKQIVFGDGNANADLMFIGEGPGEDEDKVGKPFVGKAGELLTQMIEKGLGIERSSVYICNIVKCRPPNNRTPLPNEVASCKPFLDGQIDAVKPKAIVALGKPATSLLLGRDVAISRVRGTWQEYRGIPVMPTFHPADILRQYTADNRRLVWTDLKAALERSQS
jgi:uracil-DNA glycosylase family 4